MSLQFLKYIDMFAFPITLTYQKRSKAGTSLGGFLTLGLLALFLSIFVMVSSNLWTRQNPLVYQSNLNTDSKILLKEFPIRFVLFNAKNEIVTDFQNMLSFEASIYYLDSTGNFSYENRNLVPCVNKLQQFSEVAQQQLNDQILPGAYCIDFEDTDYLNGDAPSVNTHFFNLYVFQCQGETCLSVDEIQNKLAGSYLVTQFSGITIENNNDYYNPSSQNILSKMINISFKLFKQYTINIGRSVLLSDDGLMFPNLTNYEGMKQISDFQDFSDVESSYQNASLLINIIVGWSQQKIIINRNYMKIPEALGKTMGCLSILFYFFNIIIQQYEKICFQIEIYNQIKSQGISISKKLNGSFQFTKYKHDLQRIDQQQCSIDPTIPPDKVNEKNKCSFYYYAYLKLCSYTNYSLINNKKYQQFEQINDFANDILSLERLFKTIISAKEYHQNYQLNENFSNLEINQELSSDVNLKLSSGRNIKQKIFKKALNKQFQFSSPLPQNENTNQQLS